MIAVDPNIIIRFLVKDDEKQSATVFNRFKKAEADKESFFITLLVILEVIWVLESVYEYSREEILYAMERLTRLTIFKFEEIDLVHDFLSSGKKTDQDLSDVLIGLCARYNGCDYTITFDKRASKSSQFKLMQ